MNMQKMVKAATFMLVVALLFSISIDGYAQKKGKKGKDKAKTEQAPAEQAEQQPSIDTAEADALLQEQNVWGADSAETVKNYSLYREYYKQKLYDDALPYWNYVIANAPSARKTPYIDGVKMYESYIKDQITMTICEKGEVEGMNKKECKKQDLGKFVGWKYADQDLAYAYFDSLMLLYDKRIENFGEAGFITSMRARAWNNYKPDETEKITALRKEAIEKEAEDAPHDLIYYYFKDIVKMYSDKKIEKDAFNDEFDNLMDVLSYNIENNEERAEKYEKVYNAMERWDNKRQEAALDAVTDCPTVIERWGAKYRENPEDLQTVKSVYKKLKRSRCTSAPLFTEVLLKWNSLEPSASRTRYVAQQYMKQKNFSQAASYYQKSLELEQDPTKQAKTYMQLAKIERVANKSFSGARKYARKAAELQAGWGDPYIFIGDLYMSSAGSCSGDKLDGRSVYWVAADMYARAKDIDPVSAAKAQKKLNAAYGGFPSKEKVFFVGLNKGQRFTVGCWIGQSTTVRY